MEKYTTSSGIEIEFLPISPRMIQKFDELNPEPEQPFYEFVTATGAKEKHLHDDTTVKTDAEKAALAEYRRLNAARIEKFLRFFCMRGIKVNADMSSWIQEQEFLGIPISTNKAEAKFDWLIGAVLTTVDDYKAVLIGISQASGVPDHLLKQVSDSFRGAVEGDSSQPTESPGEPVEGVSPVPGSGSSDSQRGATDEPVRPLEPVG